MKRFLTVSTATILMAGVLTCWITGLWAIAAFQVTLFGTAIVWMITTWLRPTRIELDPILIPVGLIPLIGLAQIPSGITVSVWDTALAVLVWLAHATAMLLVLQFAGSARLRGVWLHSLLIFAAVIGVLGVVQNFTSPGKIFWLFDSGYSDLVLGPFVYRNKYAQFVELFLPLALFRAATERHAVGWLAVAAALVGGVIASGSRSGFALSVLEVATFLTIMTARSWMGRRHTLTLIVRGVLFLTLAAGVVGWEFLGRRFQMDPLADVRIPIMRGAVDMVKDRPLTGFGIGAWDKAYPAFAHFDNGLYMNQAHCDWLQWPGEGGAPMLILMLWVGIVSLRIAMIQPWALGVVFVLIHGLVDYPFHQVPQFATLVFAILAAAVAERRSGRQDIRVN